MSEGDELDGLGDAVEEALDPVRHDSIMRVWRDVTMLNVESVRPPRDADDPVRRLYELTDPDPDPDARPDVDPDPPS